MNYIEIQEFKSPYGELIIGSYQNKLCLCDWKYRKMRTQIDDRMQKKLNAEYKEVKSEVIEQTINQLKEYFDNGRKTFDLPLLLIGTEFQKSVWNELLKIPFGEVKTYLELSEVLGDTKAIRAVASANGANAISIIIPCHRVIGSDNNLTGYAGGLAAKASLLKLEGYEENRNQLSLFS